MEGGVILESSTTCWLSQCGWEEVCRIAHTGAWVQNGDDNHSWALMRIFNNLTQIHKHTSDTSLCWCLWGADVNLCSELLEGKSPIYLWTIMAGKVLHTCQPKGNLNACVLLSLRALPQWYVLKSMWGHAWSWVYDTVVWMSLFLREGVLQSWECSLSMCILQGIPGILSIHLHPVLSVPSPQQVS